ncbi:hypothetical protein DFH07DRAFT_780507 [Mycena maculata]|uniref:DUF659 domain-containing protein n=1 Tax=Mycena maculata TaxID=230809 RepID=A0AAD7I2X6_9AGAR|nr:hypothetical protein DFH07DRAFT_780507 [Mycena maculata]
MAGGRPAEKFMENQGENCNYCDPPVTIEGRDQRPAVHLKDCAGAPSAVRQEAHRDLMDKGHVTISSGPILPNPGTPDIDATSITVAASAAQPGPSGPAGTIDKKRKFGTLDGYVDKSMSEAYKADADLKCFRFIVHINSAFLAHNPYLLAWIKAIRPTYDPPLRYVLSGKLLQAENSRVHLEEVQRLRGTKRITLLFDAWEDMLRRSLYGTVGAGVDAYPSLISLDDMTGNHGSADQYMSTITGALEKMDIGDAKNIIALTTDNPNVMQSFRRKFQAKFPWVLLSKHLPASFTASIRSSAKL